MWWPNGTDGISTTYVMGMIAQPNSTSAQPWGNYGQRNEGASIDSKFPLISTYIWTNDGLSSRYQQAVRGRLPDVFIASDYSNLLGMTTPAAGTPTHSVIGAYWFPATASILPGA